MINPCEQIARKIGELFSCTPMDGFVRIRTPYLYPDGDVIDLFLEEVQGKMTLSDLGETLGWLRLQTVSWKRSAKQQQLIQDVCLTHNVELFQGMLLVRLNTTEELALGVTRLAQACLRLADLWFTFRTRAVETLTDEVADFLEERQIPFQRTEHLAGRSGRVWRIDFHTRHPRRSTLVEVLSTGSRAAARGIVEHVLAVWYDLSHLKVGPEAIRFISLFDDTLDIWGPEDFSLVKDLSETAMWSRTDEFADLLVA